MLVSVALYIALWNIFISERMACSCLLWSSLSTLICKWKDCPFLVARQSKNIEMSLFFLFENFSGRSDSLLTAKVTHCKISSSVIVRFFNSKGRSFLAFSFLVPVSRPCKNRISKKFGSYRQFSSLVRSFYLKDVSLTKKSIYDSFWVYEAFSVYMNVE